jgi:hypothetical protein
MRVFLLGVPLILASQALAAQPHDKDGSRWLIDQTAVQAVDRMRPIALACSCEARSARWCELAIQRIQSDADRRAAGYASDPELKAYASAVLRTAVGVTYSNVIRELAETYESSCAENRSWRSGLKAWDDALLNGTPAPGAP